jgi:RNA-directed DNA polymerase
MRICHNSYTDIITLENLFQAWEEFAKGKRKKADVGLFERSLEDNLFSLYKSLRNKTYKHGRYEAFYVRDPKVRHIHKAAVKDRVVHHLLSKVLEQIFEPTFYAHSYSCRRNKGTHKALRTFVSLARKASKNNTSKLFVLKCDIKKFFASVDHEVLMQTLACKIQDNDFLWLLGEIIASFQIENGIQKGMPIGNLTSQLFANIYMNPLDQYVKHELKVDYYIRYADDFVILSDDKSYLRNLITKIEKFLKEEIKLSLHPNKVSMRDYYLGVDFLGYVIFPNFILPRTKTKRRMIRKISKRIQLYRQQKISGELLNQTIQSYLGYLSHANSYKLSQEIKNNLWYQLVG